MPQARVAGARRRRHLTRWPDAIHIARSHDRGHRRHPEDVAGGGRERRPAAGYPRGGDSLARLIGSVIAGWDGWRCHLYRLAVRPAWRRRGVGSVLLRAAEDRFKALGAARADAMVLDSNDLGQNLWRANGYRRQDDWRRWVKGLR